MSYSDLNAVYRALDIFNFPDNISLVRQLHSIRVLSGRSAKKIKGIPTDLQIRERLLSLIPRVSSNQIYHELVDTALEIGINIQNIENIPFELRNQYANQRNNTVNQSNVFSLKNITADKQNVHNSSINNHIKDMVKKIVSENEPHDSMWSFIKTELRTHPSWVEINEKSLKFIEDNPSNFNIDITLKQLAISIFICITHKPNRSDLIQRYNEELSDMHGTCSTGHLSRLVNVVQGFNSNYDIIIDPEKEIKTFIFRELTKALENAPEYIQEGILSQNEDYKTFLYSLVPKFQKKYGVDHTEYIKKCVENYINV